MKRLNMVKAASGRSVGTMWPAPCGKRVAADQCQPWGCCSPATTSSPRLPAAQPALPHSDHSTGVWHTCPHCGQQPSPCLPRAPRPYLDCEEGDVGKFLHKAPNLVLASFSVEPGPASHLHLGPAAAPSVPQLLEAGSQPQRTANCTAWNW